MTVSEDLVVVDVAEHVTAVDILQYDVNMPRVFVMGDVRADVRLTSARH